MQPYKIQSTDPQLSRMPTWVLLPLRLFLGITFIYAGIQKLTDPQYLRPTASSYIGKQIAGFAASSPLHTFLLQFAVPHAQLFGLLVAYGEIAIGLGALFGFLLRPAAFFGALISLLFFLTATWRVYPYFYGSDIVFFFCWLTLLLNGPLNTGLPSFDALLSLSLIQRASPRFQPSLARLLHFFLGTAAPTAPAFDSSQSYQQEQTGRAPVSQKGTTPHLSQPRGMSPASRQNQQRGMSASRKNREARRNFFLGLFTGGASVLGLAALTYALRVLGHGGDDTSSSARSTSSASSSSNNNGSSSQSNAQPSATPQSGSSNGTPASGSTVIAHVSAVSNNSSANFTIPSNGDPGILVRLNNGNFVAYDAVCTHAGCPVSYDPSSQQLACPCHGATFDPANNAAVTNPPAPSPLSSVAIHVDSATGAITLA